MRDVIGRATAASTTAPSAVTTIVQRTSAAVSATFLASATSARAATRGKSTNPTAVGMIQSNSPCATATE